MAWGGKALTSEWSNGTLIFYEAAGSVGTTYNVLSISTTAVKVGDTAQDVDFQFYGTGSISAIIDCGAATFTLTGIALSTNSSITIADDQNLTFGSSSDAIMQWDTAETIDTLKIGLDTGTRCLVLTEKGAISANLSLAQQSNPTLVGTEAGNTPVNYWLRRCYISGGYVFIVDKGSTDCCGWMLESVADSDDSNTIIRRVHDGDAYNWYLDSVPVLWSNDAENGGLFLMRTSCEIWPGYSLPSGKGSQLLGIGNNDAQHAIYFYVDTDGDLHVVDEAGNDTEIITNGGTVTPTT